MRELNKSPSDTLQNIKVKLDQFDDSIPSYIIHKPLKGVIRSGFEPVGKQYESKKL